MESRRFEARQNFQLRSREINGILNVKKAGNLADLLQICLSEGLLDNDVDQVLADRVVRVREITVKLHNTLG